MVEIINSKTSFGVKPPVVQLNKHGHIRFSVEAVKLFNLKQTDRLTFLINSEDEGIIYFYKDDSGLPLHEMVKTKTGVRYSILCRPLVKKLLRFFYQENNISILVNNKTINYGGKEMMILRKAKIKKNGNRKKHSNQRPIPILREQLI